MPPKYKEWLQFVFNHEVTSPQWHFGLDAPTFETTEAEDAELIRETFSRTGKDLRQFSDAQADEGLWFLAASSSSDYMLSILNAEIPVAARVAAVQSILELYRDCFANRCSEVLGHIEEPGATELNSICYMFWDVCPLSYLDESPDQPDLEDAVFSVISATIRIPHRACIEGGLHGLGEITYRYRERVKTTIDEFLESPDLDNPLREYAESAREGDVL